MGPGTLLPGKGIAAVLILSAGAVALFAGAGLHRPNGGKVEKEEPASEVEVRCDAGLIVPVAGVRPAELANTFDDERAQGRRHDAIDIMSPRGTPVLAAASGRIEKLFRSRAGGNTIYVRSGDRRSIQYYAHLDRYEPGLSEGAPISQGQRLGEVGFSGNASPAAPHLHFAIWAAPPAGKWWQAGEALNPYRYLTARRSPRPCP